MKDFELIASYLRRVYEKRLTTCFGGNISIRETDYFIISETGIDKSIIDENNISCVSYDNIVLNNVVPSSEYRIHSEIYKNHANINAIIHAHPPFATAYALSNANLDTRISSEMYKNLGKVVVSKYAAPGSSELASVVSDAAYEGNTIIMKNHGVIVLADNIHKAYYMLELLEQLAKMSFVITLIGNKETIESEKLFLLGGK